MTPVVAIDSSGKTASVCVMQGTDILFEETLDQGLTHSETLLPLVDKALCACSLSLADVGKFAVTVGPGSFTGLRIGLALVKGLVLPFNTPVVPVPTLQAIAADVFAYQNQPEGILVPALDARRNEVYWAAYTLGSSCKQIVADTAGPVVSIPITVEAPEKPFYFAGDGAALCNTILPEQFPKQQFHLLEQGISLSRGAALASATLQAADPFFLAPSYLRLSQAERNRLSPQTKQ